MGNNTIHDLTLLQLQQQVCICWKKVFILFESQTCNLLIKSNRLSFFSNWWQNKICQFRSSPGKYFLIWFCFISNKIYREHLIHNILILDICESKLFISIYSFYPGTAVNTTEHNLGSAVTANPISIIVQSTRPATSSYCTNCQQHTIQTTCTAISKWPLLSY